MRFVKTLLAFFMMVLMVPAIKADDIDNLHEKLLYPVVRVRTKTSGGSGTVIYSKDRAEKDTFRTYILTNHHVVENAIHVTRKWDNLTQKWVVSEKNVQVDVELFSWHKGQIIDRRVVRAAVVAHSKDEDIALLELRTGDKPYPLPVSYSAKIATNSEAEKLRIFDKIYAVGCSLGHDPIHSSGEITDLSDQMRGKTYMMGSASIIFGNSGGAVFTKIDGKFRLIGMPSLVAISRYGGGVITHMNWFVPQSRIDKFLRSHKLEFLLDGKGTPEDAFKARAEEAKKARRPNGQTS